MTVKLTGENEVSDFLGFAATASAAAVAAGSGMCGLGKN